MQMPNLNPTAPFGPRPLSAAALRAQRDVRHTPDGKAAHKWKTFRHVCEARAELLLTDRSLTVLNALLSFHPDTVLTLGSVDLVVFPSNRELSLRAHGIPASTLRRHIGALVDAGLILRRDSPNGKRYARRAPGGGIEQAFGFDLSPLVASADEMADRAARIVEERRALDALREQITLARRDIAKMLSFGVEQHVEADLPVLHREYRNCSTAGRVPRGAKRWSRLLPRWPTCRDGSSASSKATSVLQQMVMRERSPNAQRPNDGTLMDFPTRKLLTPKRKMRRHPRSPSGSSPRHAPISSTMLVTACARRATSPTPPRSCVPLLGVSPSAWEDACAAMGHGPASVTLALILQRGNAIRNPGGYLRTLARRASAGQFSVWPMLMALGASQRRNDVAGRRAPSPPSFPDEKA